MENTPSIVNNKPRLESPNIDTAHKDNEFNLEFDQQEFENKPGKGINRSEPNLNTHKVELKIKENNSSKLRLTTASKTWCLYKRRAFKIVFTRLLFAIHVLLTIWIVCYLLGYVFWLFAIGLITFLLDTVFILKKRNGMEWTWFQPVVLLYLLMELPCICLIELHKMSVLQSEHNMSTVLGDLFKNQVDNDYKTDATRYLPANVLNASSDTWMLMLGQSMLFILIISRWMMPKGEMTRSQLSALLLSYLGMASDVVDFFNVLEVSSILLQDEIFVFTVLATSAWSMFQFIFATTMTQSSDNEDGDEFIYIHDLLQKGEAKKHDFDLKALDKVPKRNRIGKLHSFIESEMWSIFVSLMMQDGPFAIVRFTCILYWNMRTYSYFFFAVKNCFVIVLQVYRLIVIYMEHNNQWEKRQLMKIQTEKEFLQYVRNIGPNCKEELS